MAAPSLPNQMTFTETNLDKFSAADAAWDGILAYLDRFHADIDADTEFALRDLVADTIANATVTIHS